MDGGCRAVSQTQTDLPDGACEKKKKKVLENMILPNTQQFLSDYIPYERLLQGSTDPPTVFCHIPVSSG